MKYYHQALHWCLFIAQKIPDIRYRATYMLGLKITIALSCIRLEKHLKDYPKPKHSLLRLYHFVKDLNPQALDADAQLAVLESQRIHFTELYFQTKALDTARRLPDSALKAAHKMLREYFPNAASTGVESMSRIQIVNIIRGLPHDTERFSKLYRALNALV